MSQLPPGFELDTPPQVPNGLPAGFAVDPAAPDTSPAGLAATLMANAKASGDPRDLSMALKAQDEANQKPLMPTSSRIEMGLGDPAYASGQLALHALPSAVPQALGLPSAKEFDAKLDNREKDYTGRMAAAGNTGTDWPRIGGTVAAGLPLSLIGPEAAPALTMGRAALTGAKSGAALSLLDPIHGAGDNYWSQKGIDAAKGAGEGVALGSAFHIGGRMLNPQPSAQVDLLQQHGVAPTLGEHFGGIGNTIEQKLTSWIPGFGDMIKSARGAASDEFNSAVYNKALAHIGEKYDGEVGRDGIKYVGDKLSAAYDDLLPKLQFKADPQFTQEYSNVAGMAQSLTPDKAKQFQGILDREVTPRLINGQMDGLAFKQMESELNRHISTFGKSASADDQMVANGLKEILSSARDSLNRSNPQYAGRLAAINKGWSELIPIEKAGASVGSVEGKFSPAQYLSAVKGSDNSVRDRATARGTNPLIEFADAGKSVLGNTVPDSGTAGRVATGVVAGGLLTGEGGRLAHMAAQHPVAAALTGLGTAAATLPYTDTGRRALSSFLSKRQSPVYPWLERSLLSAEMPTQIGVMNLLSH